MDVQPNQTQSISDDQELAKVLAGVNQQVEEATTTPPPAPVADDAADSSTAAVEATPPEVTPEVTEPAPAEATPDLTTTPTPARGSSELDSIKLEALQELRPLVDKLNVSPEEKFDTYLLLLRSTDDKELIAPAHDAAKGIQDEARRAQALLDIIKEIDFLSQNQK